ncbi:MAG: DUF3306 domain-containing protein [Rhodobacteraceae bacterium]|nr:DUF3306 domain-containing protein [Paracoccaceae bacterium]
MSEDDDSLLSRWSRRKQESRRAVPDEPAEVPPEPDTPISEDEWLAINNLPDPDNLGEGDDFMAYLSEGVPELLKRRALRQLWRSNPVLANVDGLVDYGDDFTDAAMVPEVLATVYQVGKGMLKDLVEGEDRLVEEDAPDTDQENVEVAVAAEEDVPESIGEAAYSPYESGVAHDAEDEGETFRPRRMAFKPD